MKKIIVLILMLLPMSVMASVPELTALMEKYSTTENVTVVKLTGDMLKMALAESAEAEGVELVSLSVLTTEVAPLATEISTEVDALIAGLTLSTITNIEANGAKVQIFASKSGETYSDVVVYVRESAELVLVVISGDIPESMMGELVDGMIQM